MRTAGRLVLAAAVAALLAGTAGTGPTAARTPTPAAPLPLRLVAGVHTGSAIAADGTVTAVRTITLTSARTWTTDARRGIVGRGFYLRVASGALAGTWVRESGLRHVPGSVGERDLVPPVTVRFAVDPGGGTRPYLAYRFGAAGGLEAVKTQVVTGGTTVTANRVAIVNGRRYLRVAEGAWAGWWLPANGPDALGVTCTAGNRPPGSTMVVVRAVAAAGPRLALTFDMGGRLDPAVAILEHLLVERACTTIFPTGAAAQTTTGAAVMAIVAAHPELFEIGNHTMHHCNLRDGGDGAACPPTRPDAAFVTKELADAAAIIRAATGQSPVPYWRPPYGAMDLDLRTVAAAAGYPRTVMWAVDTIDWRRIADGGPTSLDIARKIRTTPTGGVVLMHLGGWQTLGALPWAFDRLRADGRIPTSLSDLLN